ncbi:class I SAM-dependent methyltransferase [Robiginitalea sp. SC105]|uniref:class I SAM-dependent methyltransferase n=1 Tax=Robiginitalea sp. SC105 TaxID=2762332 RepID=UPI001C8D28EC|nr:class I SAM-dependent methyltransferase [Robiginitalea sp. SC105]
MKDYIPASASLLEVGCGQGDFLEAAGRVWEVTGVEPNAGARGRARNKGLEVYAGLGDVPAGSREGIVLWHVLEHIPDLEGTIVQIRSLLRQGGYLFLALPNHQSGDAKFYGEYWAGYDVPRHVWHFTKEPVKQLFGAYGFEVVQMKPMWLDAFYVSWLSEKYRGNRWAPFAGAYRGLVSNLSALRTSQPSSLVYILRYAGPSSQQAK